MASKTKELEVEFEKERETKGTIRYSEIGDEPAIGKLYVKKAAAKKLGDPEKLTVNVFAG